MAACAFLSYPSTEKMDSPHYVADIRDELVFHPSQCSPSSASNDLSSERRSSLLQDYFKSANALSRSIILEKSSVEQQHSKQWTMLSDSKRDEIVDDHFVPNEVREQYEAGLIGRRPQCRGESRLSLNRPQYLSQDGYLDEEYGDQIDGTSASPYPMSQPSDARLKTQSPGGYANQRPHPSLQSTANQVKSSIFQKSKLRSFSIRSKKNGKVDGNKEAQQTEVAQYPHEVIPLFNRDVYDLDNDVDLPDDSLLTDHIEVVEDDSFARLKPLRYSFGRKIRNKITHTQEQNSDVVDGYVVSNEGTDFLDSSTQDLTQATQSILYGTNEIVDSTQDLTSFDRDGQNSADQHSLMTSPIHMMSDETMSIASNSRLSTRTPDFSVPMQISPNRNKSRGRESPAKHPLSRSVRAGSSYMTATSDFADSRRQMFKKKKSSSGSNTQENTPITSPATSPPPSSENIPICTASSKQHPPVKQYHSIPIVKTGSINESEVTDFTNSSSELPSPICSPPPSPAGLCPGAGRNKRESGYISSTYPEEFSDEEEGSRHRTAGKHKQKRKIRTMQVERSDSLSR